MLIRWINGILLLDSNASLINICNILKTYISTDEKITTKSLSIMSRLIITCLKCYTITGIGEYTTDNCLCSDCKPLVRHR